MSELVVMDQTGDTKTIFDPNNPDEVAVARDTFNALKAKGYLAYEVKGDGEKGEVMQEFNPIAGKVILSPPMAGG